MDLRSRRSQVDVRPDRSRLRLQLATTLMATVVIFRAGDGTLSVAPAAEYDGDEAAIVREIDPFAS